MERRRTRISNIVKPSHIIGAERKGTKVSVNFVKNIKDYIKKLKEDKIMLQDIFKLLNMPDEEIPEDLKTELLDIELIIKILDEEMLDKVPDEDSLPDDLFKDLTKYSSDELSKELPDDLFKYSSSDNLENYLPELPDKTDGKKRKRKSRKHKSRKRN